MILPPGRQGGRSWLKPCQMDETPAPADAVADSVLNMADRIKIKAAGESIQPRPFLFIPETYFHDKLLKLQVVKPESSPLETNEFSAVSADASSVAGAMMRQRKVSSDDSSPLKLSKQVEITTALHV
jgi:hypothetical protein